MIHRVIYTNVSRNIDYEHVHATQMYLRDVFGTIQVNT